MLLDFQLPKGLVGKRVLKMQRISKKQSRIGSFRFRLFRFFDRSCVRKNNFPREDCGHAASYVLVFSLPSVFGCLVGFCCFSSFVWLWCESQRGVGSSRGLFACRLVGDALCFGVTEKSNSLDLEGRSMLGDGAETAMIFAHALGAGVWSGWSRVFSSGGVLGGKMQVGFSGSHSS